MTLQDKGLGPALDIITQDSFIPAGKQQDSQSYVLVAQNTNRIVGIHGTLPGRTPPLDANLELGQWLGLYIKIEIKVKTIRSCWGR